MTRCLALLWCFVGVGLAAPAWAAAAAPKEKIAFVRWVSLESAPEGWLELEEVLLAHAVAKLGGSVKPASVAAEALEAPGAKLDKAREKIREAIDAAEAALAAGDAKSAVVGLSDMEEILGLRPVVAVLPRSLLLRFHAADAQIRGASKKGKAAQRDFLGLVDLATDADPALVKKLEKVAPDGEKETVGLVVQGEGTVYLDGIRLGKAPVRRYDLQPGTHYLRVVERGRIAKGERLSVTSGKIIRRQFYLDVASDPMRERATALRGDNPGAPLLAKLGEVARTLGVTKLVLLLPATQEGAMVLRAFDAKTESLGTAAQIMLNQSGPELLRAVDPILGIATEAKAERAETLTAAPASSVSAKPGTPLSQSLSAKPASANGDESFLTNRWLWVGVGGAVVTGIVVGIIAATAQGSQPAKAAVYLCPPQGPCAP
jgi:hypothetical protein